MKKVYLLVLTGLLFAGCSDDNDTSQPPAAASVWEFSHRSYMLLNGNVSHLIETWTDDSDPESPNTFTLLEASFDASGHLTAYNPTGVDFSAPESQRATRGWGVESDAYEYSYDASGRMNTVTRHVLGEMSTITYQITYGTHERYVPTPFAVMDKPLWLLQGVMSITGSDGSSLLFDGTQAKIDYPTSWSGKKLTIISFEGTYPSRSVETTTRNEEIVLTITTEYKWGENGRLLHTSSTTQLSGDPVQPTSVEYSSKLLYSPLRMQQSEAGTIQVELLYDYFTDGLPAAARYSIGEGSELFGEAFTKEYSSTDAQGNWRECRKIISAGGDSFSMPISRKIEY